MGPQTFVLATLLTVLIFLPVLQQLGGSVALRFARDAEKALAGFLSAPDLASGKAAKVPGNNAIRFENVSFAYPGEQRREALHNASFDIPIGGVTAIVGPSGAGKSTVLNLIARFYDPSFGAVKLGGIDLQDIAPHDLLAKMSIGSDYRPQLKARSKPSGRIANSWNNHRPIATCGRPTEILCNGVWPERGQKGTVCHVPLLPVFHFIRLAGPD